MNSGLKRITSRENQLFKDLRKLAGSSRARENAGMTLLDGCHLIQAYEAAQGPVDTLVVDEERCGQPEIAALIASRDAISLPSGLFRDVAVVDSPTGVMALIAMPPVASADANADSVLLDGIQDAGNVGTILRTAAAAGFRQVLLSADCAGVWSPRVLRAGQGAHFALHIVPDADLAAFLSSYRGIAAVTQLEDAVSLYQAELSGPVAWVFGSEGRGVREDVAAAAKLKIRIPMADAVESLNVGAAAAVCLFETMRRRLAR